MEKKSSIPSYKTTQKSFLVLYKNFWFLSTTFTKSAVQNLKPPRLFTFRPVHPSTRHISAERWFSRLYKSCTTYETCELRRLWNFITKVLKIWKKIWNMLFQKKSSPFKLRGLFENSSCVGWVIHVWRWLISMFNFVKLDRRIKLKGFDNILYSTTAVQLRTGTTCCWFGDPEYQILRSYVSQQQTRSIRPIWYGSQGSHP